MLPMMESAESVTGTVMRLLSRAAPVFMGAQHNNRFRSRVVFHVRCQVSSSMSCVVGVTE